MIRFGVIGTNWITERFLQAASEIQDFELTAVYSRTMERGSEFAAKFEVPHLFTDVHAMAASKELDAVYIASPNSFHAEQAIICMNQGKHVLCEKPLATNTHEVEEMIKVAQENNVLLMEALKSTHLPNFKVIQANIHKIGKVRRYVANCCQYSSRYDAYKEGKILNAFNPTLGNGSLMDLGIYCLYPMVVLFGKPQRIQANGIMLCSGVDGEGSILAQYAELEGVVMYSKITDSYLSSEIQGEAGSIMIDKVSDLEKVEIRYRDGAIEDISQEQTDKTMFYEIKEFIELIKSGRTESPINTYLHSLTVMEIMDEARKQIGLVFPADKIS